MACCLELCPHLPHATHAASRTGQAMSLKHSSMQCSRRAMWGSTAVRSTCGAASKQASKQYRSCVTKVPTRKRRNAPNHLIRHRLPTFSATSPLFRAILQLPPHPPCSAPSQPALRCTHRRLLARHDALPWIGRRSSQLPASTSALVKLHVLALVKLRVSAPGLCTNSCWCPAYCWCTNSCWCPAYCWCTNSCWCPAVKLCMDVVVGTNSDVIQQWQRI